MIGAVLLLSYAATIPAANWMIGHVGQCSDIGVCFVSVGFGLHAPSGVLMVGIALVLRDLVQMALGWRMGVAAIAAGSLISGLLAPASLVIASAAAFALSELADFAVYTPLSRKGLGGALIASGIAGALVDSAVFLLLAFGTLDFLAGQVVGKVYASVLAAITISIIRAAQRMASQQGER